MSLSVKSIEVQTIASLKLLYDNLTKSDEKFVSFAVLDEKRECLVPILLAETKKDDLFFMLTGRNHRFMYFEIQTLLLGCIQKRITFWCEPPNSAFVFAWKS